MKNIIFSFALATLFLSCDTKIKNSETQVKEESGTEISGDPIPAVNGATENDEVIGSWIGYFEQDEDDSEKQKHLNVDENYAWNRENKINLSIDQINDGQVIGHSVVAGNNRPFKGLISDGQFSVKEPGDNKYDGEFNFEIEENKLVGTWKAFKKIDIPKRKYTLEKKTFAYDPDQMLEKAKAYVNWNKFIKDKSMEEIDEGVFEEWITATFSSATDKIYQINASNILLTKKEVENLKKGDLIIIRNTIYARHGYSFKDRPLRVFLDAQPWYIPINNDIKSDFTETEKENIKLLLRYEKNAKEFYDYFGRG
ncbi:YARHG domain-containing protein [Frigoriflavimonas asaccharolytica]|uniref:YARHG domain-containing protein n=1 Tax=Frigoriflavimonas asaccharolytica TaxID=2735899 RepID=A0A8J8G977_9FLAO|nr:YARHG domain-containing protein [Frigoriflavimonas asaccharolytica]NRS91297.1 hypothetical protein [Frigoriflavimonas asaccharolytica]